MNHALRALPEVFNSKTQKKNRQKERKKKTFKKTNLVVVVSFSLVLKQLLHLHHIKKQHSNKS